MTADEGRFESEKSNSIFEYLSSLFPIIFMGIEKPMQPGGWQNSIATTQKVR